MEECMENVVRAGARESEKGSVQTDTERIQRQNPSNSFIAKSLN